MFKLTWDISELINIVVKIPYCNKPDNNFKDRKEIYNYLLTIIPSKIEFSPIELEIWKLEGLILMVFYTIYVFIKSFIKKAYRCI